MSAALRAAGVGEILLHTGQHADAAMAGDIERAAGLPEPGVRLRPGGATALARVAAAARGVEEAARRARPDAVLASGDTDSTLAAALGARAAGIPFVHGEAGVRLGRFDLPEEANRVVADHLAALLLCPTARAAAAARAEGVRGAVEDAGDPILDGLAEAAAGPASWHGEPPPAPYFVATVHRAENADDPRRLRAILEALAALPHAVLLPLHPRTGAALRALPGGPPAAGALRAGGPLPRADLLRLVRGAVAVLTDSGGVQREAHALGVPCIVLRDRCEWTETVDAGWAACAGADPARIAALAASPPRGAAPPDLAPFGGGAAAPRWAEALLRWFRGRRGGEG